MANTPSKPIFKPETEALLSAGTQLALASGFVYTATEHVFLALLSNSTLAKSVLPSDMSADIEILREKAAEFVSSLADDAAKYQPKVLASRFSPSMNRAIQVALHLASSSAVSPQLLFFGIICLTMVEDRQTAVAVILGKHFLAKRDEKDQKTNAALKDLLRPLFESLAGALGLQTEKIKDFPQPSPSALGLGEIVKVPVPQTAKKFTADFDHEDLSGPVDSSHWVYPGKIMCGKSPGQMTESEIEDLITKGGVNTFVCLQTWYTEYGCTDYRDVVKNLLKKKPDLVVNGAVKEGEDQPFIEFIHAPTPDFHICSDSEMIKRIDELKNIVNRRNDNRVLYAHCFSGHGRTGTSLVNLMASLEGNSASRAMVHLQAAHMFRKDCAAGGFRCALGKGALEASKQQEQTNKLKSVMRRGYRTTWF